MNKELTLLICCHNGSQYLRRMLESIFDQTLSPDRWELLILFDACTDGSMKVFEEAWNDLCAIQGKPHNWLNPVVIHKSEKRGLANAKNFALKHANTPYIAYLDADDSMFPQRLEAQYGVLQMHSWIDVCGCQVWDGDSHGRLFVNCFPIGQYNNHVQIEQRLYHENVICHGSVMLRRQALLDVNGYKETRDVLGMEDWDLWLRMLDAGKKFCVIPERLYIWSMGTSVER